MMRRVAAIDCGTNSIRLLVADLDLTTGTAIDLDRRMEIVRLGEGVDRTGRLSEAALARTFAACEVYAARIAELGATDVRFVATSASRDVENRADFVRGVLERIGVEPEVVSGDEEAALSFRGPTGALKAAGIAGPYLVVDIGGGSTEFILGDSDVRASRSVDIGVGASRSVDMGCVRLTERHLHDDPPTAAQVAAARADIDARLDEAAAAVPLDTGATLVGLAGTVTTLAGIALGLPAYDPAAIHLSRLRAEDVHAITERLLVQSHDERAAIPVMHPGRVDVIAGGALVLDAIVRRTSAAEVVVSEHDILDGIAWSLADRPTT